VTEPQKVPLILLTDRPVQLETPRHYFRTAFTPTEAFYVRWHLEGIPNSVDLQTWKLHIEGNVNKPFSLSLPDLMQKFKPVSVAAVNQCSGNSRSRLQPRVPGGQWGDGKRDVDQSAPPRASRYGRCKERLFAGAVSGP
jgi:DMSO/TMAO reductase YedYZ molybdopterin-dependent catalytic subunit